MLYIIIRKLWLRLDNRRHASVKHYMRKWWLRLDNRRHASVKNSMREWWNW